MNSIIDSLVSIFNWLYNTNLYNVPLLVWLTIPLVVGIILKFLNGQKESK